MLLMAYVILSLFEYMTNCFKKQSQESGEKIRMRTPILNFYLHELKSEGNNQRCGNMDLLKKISLNYA